MRPLLLIVICLTIQACATTPYKKIADRPEEEGLHRIKTEDGYCYVLTDDDEYGTMQCDFKRSVLPQMSPAITNTNNNTVNVYVDPAQVRQPAPNSTEPTKTKSHRPLTDGGKVSYGEDPATGKVYSIIRRD